MKSSTTLIVTWQTLGVQFANPRKKLLDTAIGQSMKPTFTRVIGGCIAKWSSAKKWSMTPTTSMLASPGGGYGVCLAGLAITFADHHGKTHCHI